MKKRDSQCWRCAEYVITQCKRATIFGRTSFFERICEQRYIRHTWYLEFVHRQLTAGWEEPAASSAFQVCQVE